MTMAPERTLVLVKPDGVRRGLTGEVLRRIEAKGYRVVALELRTAGRSLLEEHYAEHRGKPFFEPLVTFMPSGRVGLPLRPDPPDEGRSASDAGRLAWPGTPDGWISVMEGRLLA